MRKTCPRPLAFTLIEVLMVVAILGIAGAIIVPQILQAGTLHVQAAARMVIADVIFAQSDAVTRQQTRQVVFDATNDQYYLEDQNGATLSAPWQSGGLYLTNFKTDSRFIGVTLTNVNFGSTNTLSFDLMGTPTPSAGGSVDLVSGSTHYRITVAPFTGNVTVAPVASGG